jgi:acetylornithine deacetylase/succinyl-diaminopimelate desuccinylase-like protein
MDLEAFIAQALAVQRIPSPTFDEHQRAEYVRDQLQQLGLEEVQIDATGNVLGRRGAPNEPAILVSAHLDSVFARDAVWPARREGDCLRGPGIGDNALGVAALIELARDLVHSLPGACVWLAGTVGEEGLGNLRGMRALVDSFRGRVSSYLVIEGMSLGNVYHTGLPARRLRISVRTPGGHSWTHAGQPSAAHELIRLAERILRFPLPSQPRTTVNIGRVEGGTAINAIAARASMEVDLRSEDEQVAAAMEMAVTKLADAHTGPGIQVFTESIGTRPGGGIPADHPLVVAAVGCLRAQGFQDVRCGAGSTDASAPLSQGLPAVCVGLTRGTMAHTVEETIEIGPITRGYAALFQLVQEAARLAAAEGPTVSLGRSDGVASIG